MSSYYYIFTPRDVYDVSLDDLDVTLGTGSKYNQMLAEELKGLAAERLKQYDAERRQMQRKSVNSFIMWVAEQRKNVTYADLVANPVNLINHQTDMMDLLQAAEIRVAPPESGRDIESYMAKGSLSLSEKELLIEITGSDLPAAKRCRLVQVLLEDD
jgi:hypothetical protein